MGATSDETRTTASSVDEDEWRRDAPPWFYPWIGLIAGAAIVANAMLPGDFAGVSLVAAALLVGLVGSLARRAVGGGFDLPLTATKVIYLVTVAVVLIGSLVAVWTVVRPGGTYWLGWVLGALVGAVVLSGTRIMRGGRTA
jgi:hypothetical protein